MNEPSGSFVTKRLAKRLSLNQLSTTDNNSAVLKGVTLLAAGEWHDSLTPYPTVYTAENLAKYTVEDNTGYKVHAFDRGMDEEIGEAVNIHYDESQNAIVTDLVFHGATQASRDVLSAIKRRHAAGKPAYVSIEMMTRDVPTEHGMEARDIAITGWVATATPACKKCAIPKQQTEHKKTMTENPPSGDEPEKKTSPDEQGKPEESEAKTLTIEALAERIAALEERLNATDKACSEHIKADDAGAKIKTLSETIESLKKELTASGLRVKALEESAANPLPLGKELSKNTEPIAEYTTRHY